jgi:hypothetical protein
MPCDCLFWKTSTGFEISVTLGCNVVFLAPKFGFHPSFGPIHDSYVVAPRLLNFYFFQNR